jgi:hypothetical protein
MRRTIMALLAIGLVAGSLAAPASAGKAKAKKTTLYLHGTETLGEAALTTTWLDGMLMKMDGSKPGGDPPKSMFVTNYVGGPNTQCSGNGLLPVWKGDMAGTVKGTVTVTLHTIATPATQMNVELFPDGSGGCESDLGSTGYTPPAEAQVVEVAPGHAETKVVFKNVNFKSEAWLILQLSIANNPHPGQVRVLFDSADFASNVALSIAK